ncbi:hypothetical protein [Microbacterium sp. TNHR37B]|uniref:hypothetical protein n=1 Tax=Microbacterium sp. TNHR37B TaxID=1775956 RepID=UPI0007B1992C|nr:hypothetical protein [Microbacterium sp. TNHR37B]KZE91619.1 hypothetical protein AVP41_01163 [Microbacterium sp. TNHR37B]
MTEWWNEFMRAVTDGAWTAGLLQGLAGGTAAIAVAFLILKRQLVADRKLAEDERKETQRIAQQEKLSVAAAGIGRLLAQIALSNRDYSNRELGALLRSTSKPLDVDLANTAKVEATIYFPHFNAHVAVARLKERDALWAVGRSVLASDPSITDEAMGHALRQALAPANSDLRAIANELIRWTGEGDFPDSLAVLRSADPLPTTREAKSPIRKAWKSRSAASMEAAARTRLPRPASP